jgi:hypothetical protein
VPDIDPTPSGGDRPPCPRIVASDRLGVAVIHTAQRWPHISSMRQPTKSHEEGADAEPSAEGSTNDAGLPAELVRFIAAHGSAAKLLVEHAPTKDGRCPRCPAGAASSGRVKSPCTLFLAAQAAVRLS